MAFAVMLLLVIAGYVFIQYDNYYSGLAATKEWARLNDFPATATEVTVSHYGSMFTREFTVEFNAPLADIETWLMQSPGTKEVVPVFDGTLRKYSITPGGGAQHAELDLDEATGHVRINAYWS